MYIPPAPHFPAAYPANRAAPFPVDRANQRLARAIEYGNERESPAKIDEALELGASINGDGCYDCHPLVIAVRSNQPWAISSLMIRGADLPPTPADGVDLLMEACRNGHVEMVKALIHIAKFSVAYADASGKTALHHAVSAGETEIVNILIKAGADVDAKVSGLAAGEIPALFPYADVYPGEHVTPLMIAAASGNAAMVDALLAGGADRKAGDCSALILAARGGHHPVFEALRKDGARLAECKNAAGLEGLRACIYSRMPAGFLQVLIGEHDFTDEGDDGDEDNSMHSPLGIAVSLRNLPVIDLLMSAGAPVEHHARSREPNMLWHLALPEGMNHSIYADLLTARSPAAITPDDPDGFTSVLEKIVDNCHEPPAMACAGIFTSLLRTCAQPLRALAGHRGLMHRRQCLVETAWILQCSLSPMREVRETYVPAPDLEWHNKMEQEKSEQLDALLEGSQRFIDHCMQQLTDATGLDFFLGCDRDCDEGVPMASFIKERLLASSGAPTTIIRLIRDAWINAARWAKEWTHSAVDERDGNRFLLALAHNLMRKGIDDFGDRDTLMNACLDTLRQALPTGSLALGKFCADPSAWLRKFEHRHNLDDPDDVLAERIQLELGLPRETCEAIVERWHDALRAARTRRWSTPVELHALLKRQLAQGIPGALQLGQGERFIPQSAMLMLQRTRRDFPPVTPSPLPAGPARKRRAEGDAPDAPPAKAARTSQAEEASSEASVEASEGEPSGEPGGVSG